MEEIIKISDDVFEQIKDFDARYLTEEQKLLVDKLILNEELKNRYKELGLCKECKQLNTINRYDYDNYRFSSWCQPCNVEHFQQNFKNWTSGNGKVDEFIQKAQLNANIEWIEHDKFENIEYLAKGGFGTTYKAIWKDGDIIAWDYENNQWKRRGRTQVALKRLHNSQAITTEFLKEVELHILLAHKSRWVIRCFGITKDPETNNFMMVMELKKGSFRQHLNNNFNSLNWREKLYNLQSISYSLKDIHNSGLIHRDLHCGNLLSDDRYNEFAHVTDLGLCQPANTEPSQSGNKKIYGVLPYVAPEVLKGKGYTQASDIYAFGIIAYEICTGLPPYHNIAHDELLAKKVCQGLRPKFNYKVPQLIFDVIKQCWDADPLKRPKANELQELFFSLYVYIRDDKFDSVMYKQIEEAEEINEKLTSLETSLYLSPTETLSYITHPQAVYTSRLLDFKNLPEAKNTDRHDSFETGYSDSMDSMRMDFIKLDIDSKDESN